jgi:hypothetical protein
MIFHSDDEYNSDEYNLWLIIWYTADPVSLISSQILHSVHITAPMYKNIDSWSYLVHNLMHRASESTWNLFL